MEVPTMVAVNRVRPGSADEFERWFAEVALPASRASGLGDDRVRVLRDPGDENVFLFLFFGGSPEDFELHDLLEHAYGAARADDELAHLMELFASPQELWPVRAVGV